MAKKKTWPKKKIELSTEIFHKNDHIMDNYEGESCCQVKNFKLIADLIPELNNFCYPNDYSTTLDMEIKRFKNILIYEDYFKGDFNHFEGYLSEDTEYEHTCENNNEKIGDLPIEELIKVHQMICDGKMNPTKLTSYQYFKVMMYMKENQPKIKIGPKSFKQKQNRKGVRKSPRGKSDETETDIEEPVRYNLRQTRNSKRTGQDLPDIDDSVVSYTRKKRKKVEKSSEKVKEILTEVKKLDKTPTIQVEPKTQVTPIPDSPESPENPGLEDKVIDETNISSEISVSPESPGISPESPVENSPSPIPSLVETPVSPVEKPTSPVEKPTSPVEKPTSPEILKVPHIEKLVEEDEKIPTPPLVRKLALRDPRLLKRIEEQRIFDNKKLVADKIIENYRKEKVIREQFEKLERQKEELKRKEEELHKKLEEDVKLKEEELKKKKKKQVDMELLYKTPLSDLHSEEKISYNQKPNEPKTELFKYNEIQERSKFYSNISYNTHTEHSQTLHQQIHFHIHPNDYYCPEYPTEVDEKQDNRNRYFDKPFRRRYEDFHRRDRYNKEKRYTDQCFRRRKDRY